MRKMILLPLLMLSFSGFSQDITGIWNGVLQGAGLHLVLNIEKSENGFTATMVSPDQSASEIPISSIQWENPSLKWEISQAGIIYEGKLDPETETISGTFKQNGFSYPLNLQKGKLAETKISRPQEPKKPFPYKNEEVKFYNSKDSIYLAGTLTVPEQGAHFPAVILISGSGPQNRDEEILNHKPFLVLADKLTRNGIAVLRFDDRGVGESQGDFSHATTLDLVSDVKAGMEFLKFRNEINSDEIGLIGHSEGGMIAPMLAAKSKHIAFIVLLAGPGIPGKDLLLLQKEKMEHQAGFTDEQVVESNKIMEEAYNLVLQNENLDNQELQKKIHTYYKNISDSISNSQIQAVTRQILNPWMRFYLKTDPATALEEVSCPVLAINGSKDIQVSADENLKAIAAALKRGGNRQVTIKKMDGLNHLFQEAETGSQNEYAQIEQTFAPAALELITEWVLKQVH